MNLPNQKPPPQRLTPLPQMQFIPWSAQAPSAFRGSHSYPPLAALAPYHPSVYFQQQNNYYNTNIAPTPLLYPYHSIYQALGPPSCGWVSPPALHPSKRLSKPKGQIPVICLEEDSGQSVIVISESEESPPCQKKSEPVSKNARVQIFDPLQRSRRVQQIQRETRRCLTDQSQLIPVQKVDPPKETLSLGRKAKDRAKLERDRVLATKDKTKIVKKKSVSNYPMCKLTPHQKKLSQLSECREYMPGEVMVGPQFQARVPWLRGHLGHTASRAERRCWLKVRQQGLLARLLR